MVVKTTNRKMWLGAEAVEVDLSVYVVKGGQVIRKERRYLVRRIYAKLSVMDLTLLHQLLPGASRDKKNKSSRITPTIDVENLKILIW